MQTYIQTTPRFLKPFIIVSRLLVARCRGASLRGGVHFPGDSSHSRLQLL